MHRSLFLPLVCSLMADPAAAMTPVSGPILTPTVWTRAGSPYIVTGSIVVGNNAVLRINPGVVVQFRTGFGIQVGTTRGPGTLIARGTSGQPVRFTSAEPMPMPGDWTSIEFGPSAVSGTATTGSALDHVIVEFGGRGGSAAAVIGRNSSPWIANSVFREHSAAGVDISLTTGSAPPISISGCQFSDNSNSTGAGGLRVSSPASITVLRSRFSGLVSSLARAACSLSSTGGGVTVADCSLSTCTGPAAALAARARTTASVQRCEARACAGGGIVAAGGTVTLSRCRVESCPSGRGLRVDPSNRVFVSDCHFLSNPGGGIEVENAGVATLEDNTVVGNGSNSRLGGGVLLWAGSGTGQRSVIRRNLLANNRVVGTGVRGRGAGLHVRGVNLLIEENSIINNVASNFGGGVYVTSSRTVLQSNRISYNVAAFGGGAACAFSTDLFGNIWVCNQGSSEGGAIFANSSATNLDDPNNGPVNQFADNRSPRGDDLAFGAASGATMTARTPHWRLWSAGQPPANMIYDFFDNATRGMVQTGVPVAGGPNYDRGAGLPGGSGQSALAATGSISPGSTLTLRVSGAASSSSGSMLLGVGIAPVTHVYIFDALVTPLPILTLPIATDGSGAASLALPVPPGTSTGVKLMFQAAVVDLSSRNGLFTLTNSIAAFN